jgi:hypothetical protein
VIFSNAAGVSPTAGVCVGLTQPGDNLRAESQLRRSGLGEEAY